MPNNAAPRLLFVINPVSGGKQKINWEESINDFFKNRCHNTEFYKLTGNNDKTQLKNRISEFSPDKVIAVGGDGTVKLVAEQLMHTSMALGILPAGSANGMAKELNIPDDEDQALKIIDEDHVKKIDLVNINNEISIHLSDAGLNALLIKYFEQDDNRGMWGYIKVAFRVFRSKRLLRIELSLNQQNLLRAAYMCAFANAKKYGTGAVINPEGELNDGKFEVLIVRKISLIELFRMLISHKPFNPEYIETLQTEQVTVKLHKKTHFQIDGEYKGKVDMIEAKILPAALNILVQPL